MIDRLLDNDINNLKNFLELWGKFHSIYGEIISRERIGDEDDQRFIETRDMIRAKYRELQDALAIRYMPHGRVTDPVSDILAIETIRYVSEKKMKKLADDWKDSYIFLNNILENLKGRAKVSRGLKPPFALFKRIFALK